MAAIAVARAPQAMLFCNYVTCRRAELRVGSGARAQFVFGRFARCPSRHAAVRAERGLRRL